tara:strand:- start:77 stop:322 length:246 start_codon:yes stop_codon:yes gene_type:complete
MKFAFREITWLNKTMRNVAASIKEKMIEKYKDNSTNSSSKRSDINILLNRIQVNKKNETKKKLYFSAAASTGLILFGLIIF